MRGTREALSVEEKSGVQSDERGSPSYLQPAAATPSPAYTASENTFPASIRSSQLPEMTSLEEELVEKNALIEALEKGLLEATETIDESAAEIKRLQMLVTDYETRLSLSHGDGPHGPDPVDDTASVIERSSVNSSTIRGSSAPMKHTITKMGAIIVEEDGQDEVTVIENHAVKELSDKVYMIEFENLHLKEKLEKVLHTVDCLNDEIANLKDELKAKEDLVISLQSPKKMNTPTSRQRQRAGSSGIAAAVEQKNIEPAPPKRIWGPAAKLVAARETPPAAPTTVVRPTSPTPVTPFNLSKGRKTGKELKTINPDHADEPFDSCLDTNRSRAHTLRSGSDRPTTPRKQNLNSTPDGGSTPSRKSSLTQSISRPFASTGQRKKILL